jgi:hypothetical protein
MIETRNLTKRFGKVTAVDDLSFMVDGGKVTGGPRARGAAFRHRRPSMAVERLVGRHGPSLAVDSTSDAGSRAVRRDE